VQRVLIAGGAGFAGRNLAERLSTDGVDVVVIDNLSSPSPLPIPPNAEFIEASVVDPFEVDGPLDVVFNLASPASPPRYVLDPVGTLRTGAEGTRRLLDLAERKNAVFLMASTSEIYGDPLVHPQSEDYNGNVDVTSPRACYDEAKRYAEAMVFAYRRTGAVTNSRIARIFNTYGPGMAPDDGRVITNFITQALAGEPLTIFGDGSQTRSFCFVDDLVDGLIRLAESDETEPVNLGNPSERTMADVADQVSGLIGDTGRVYVELPHADPTRRRPVITRARTLLGWEPKVTFEDGLPQTVEYLTSLPR
jgi:dTDP-glucose 4,6-dehydratase